MTDWHRTGRTSPVDSRTFPGGHALVVRREGGRWEGTVTLTVDAGDDAKARAKVDALIGRLVDAETECAG